MRNQVLAICDSDEEYMGRLAQRLMMRDSFPFRVVTFSDSDRIRDSELLGNMEVLLVTDGELRKLEKWKNFLPEFAEKVVILLDEGSEENTSGRPSVYKFQSGENIRKEILCIYGQAKGDGVQNNAGHKQTKIIGVYSPVGRCCQTSFCLVMGQILAKEKKVIYFNFEPYSGFSRLLNKADEKDLTDLVYAMRGDGKRLAYQLESMISNVNGLDYIAPATSFIDLQSITGDNWIVLLEALKAAGTYDFVILDLSEMVQGLLDVLRECSLVYTITEKDGIASAKMIQYENLLRMYEYEDVMNKTRKCEFPRFRNLPDGLDQLPYSELAVYVKQSVLNAPEFQ